MECKQTINAAHLAMLLVQRDAIPVDQPLSIPDIQHPHPVYFAYGYDVIYGDHF